MFKQRKRGRQKGVRKCQECGSMHLPGSTHCGLFKALPHGCPGCQTARSLKVKAYKRTKGLDAKLTCENCGLIYFWSEKARYDGDYDLLRFRPEWAGRFKR